MLRKTAAHFEKSVESAKRQQLFCAERAILNTAQGIYYGAYIFCARIEVIPNTA